MSVMSLAAEIRDRAEALAIAADEAREAHAREFLKWDAIREAAAQRYRAARKPKGGDR